MVLSKWWNSSIWPYLGPTTPSQTELGNNGSEDMLHIPQSSKTGASPSDGLELYSGHSLEGEIVPFQPTGLSMFKIDEE